MGLKSNINQYGTLLKTCVILALIQNGFCHQVVSDEEYYQMPRIYDLDDFEKCQSLGTTYKYCVFETNLKPRPNVTSHIWNIIERVNSDPRNYRHDIIMRGRCMKIINESKEAMFDRYTEIFSNEVADQGLQVYINRTESTCNYFERHMDWFDYFGILVIFGTIGWVLFCTGYDVAHTKSILKLMEDVPENKPPEKLYIQVIQCFSIWKNWCRLRSTKNSKENLKYIQGTRFMFMNLVILGHTAFIAFNSPLRNPIFFERLYHDLIGAMAYNGPVIVQVFLMISGLVLALPFYKIMAKRKFHLKYFFLAIIGRFIRLTPSYGMVILFNSTLFYYLSNGPLWEHNVGTERDRCRRNGWTNLLYLNNEVGIFEMCLQNGWYLAADFQIYLFALCLIALMWFMQNRIKSILFITLFISMLVPGVITYYHSLMPIFLNYPETLRQVFYNDPTFFYTYIRGYTNASAYVIGMITAYLMYTGRIRTEMKLATFTKVIANLGIVTASVGLMMAGSYLYSDYYVYDRFWASFIAATYKPVFVLSVMATIYIIHQDCGVVYRYVLEWRPIVILGRLAFGAYLVNLPLVKLQAGKAYIEIYYDFYSLAMFLFSNLVMSYFMAFVLSLFVECPISAFLRLLFSQFVSEEIDKNVTVTKDELTRTSHSGSHMAIVNLGEHNRSLGNLDQKDIMEIHRFGLITKSKEEATE